MTAAALATACGGSTDGDGSPNGGAGGTGQGGTAGTSGSGTGGTGTGGTSGVGGGTGGTSGSSGTGGDGGGGGGYLCPSDLPGTWDSCNLPAGAVCKWDVPCQSGVVSIEMECDPTNGFVGWTLLPKACTKPYDSCPNTDLYCSDTWTKPMGTNPPSPCPVEPPQAGSTCFSGAFGGVWPNCGYPCYPGANQWTVATCNPDVDAGTSTWELDGACDVD